ncbi:DUF4105 domain-containing protein [Hydrocarboniphaga sp.]|jgi:hypothetical protein|uniref:Uncharacterized protein n=1 Tax=Hydrocarboniphaga effusa AP103 TaxID=1172194 RepID=I7Z8M3_9GAMM|nr:DUF4105 domain-containing protein [Hydrocarboniphaga sp.]EIT68174.1 hypothetical protein WQQ_46090 [Hydrocarboniphaga effusa AP103]MDZ4078269.1 DUF4105 domain-containing protein [Hydrocarboniphaga sp.]
MRQLFLLTLLGLLSQAAFAVAADAAVVVPDAGYLAELKQQAHERRLDHAPMWQRLLHYRPSSWPGGVESTVDFPQFFLAADGKHDPRAELDTTLDSFFGEGQREGEPAQCRAKARYEWLKNELAFDSRRLPEQVCERFDEWLRGLDAAALAVVFASNDLYSPSSMFGHTLLRVDAHGQGGDDRLLAYAVNYAANTGEQNGLTYAVRGLGGSYAGTFSIYPYYEKVKEYARFEHRDLWEYPLQLDHAAVQRLLRHLWELRGVEFDYYFFTENCSYQLLSLLEVARPDLRLVGRFDGGVPYAIPIDTVRELRRQHLLGAPVYRAALAQQLRYRLQRMPRADREWAVAYARGDAGFDDSRFARAEPAARTRMLETAQDELYFLFRSGAVQRESGIRRSREALVARSRIAEPADFEAVPRPAFSPDEGHGSGRFGLGLRNDGADSAALLRIRPAYHDRLDPPAGYLAGGELEFFDLGLLADEQGVDLDSLRLLSVQAVSPRDVAFRPWSWQASAGVRRSALPTLRAGGSLGAYADGGGGLAWAPVVGVQTYGFAFVEVDVNRDRGQGYALAGGLRAGVSAQWSTRWTQQLELDALSDLAGGAMDVMRLRWGAQWQFIPTQGLRLQLAGAQTKDSDDGSAELIWLHYF